MTALKAWFDAALQPDIVRRGVRVSLVVGTLLTVINQGERVLALELDAATVARIVLTYLVPYGVSTWSAVGALRQAAARGVIGPGSC